MARTADPDLAERRRRAILDAALHCFRRQGFHQTSMASICAEADISAGALYRYFPSKADIIVAIAEEEHRDAEELIDAIANGADITESLMTLVRDVVGRCVEDHPLTADVLAEAMRDTELAKRFREHIIHMQRRLAIAIAAGQRRGSVDLGINPETAARLVTVMIDGLILRAAVIRDDDPEALTAALRTFVDRLLKPGSALTASLIVCHLPRRPT
jgi:AcrR family transcriptional regulator